ncbi:MAG: Txe/YoeB family addiction module toxin [Nostoc sp. DedVER02]|uniref:Txe/YoeB family addiction module toxin n=1 Tax=unclassified Nostoc TaxID=2593658 RepID=UPI002AD41043|nr:MULTISPECIES: Txe/YoeB family addiction module toxin [unclassified Nostoc]MDZ7986619.1 Txe/YoeB family addiction module toxin [Nostoc sp. DedVER02]MDZ8112428.1 Txe/YoeB family addiction module toxin [Nostoc sp. DedVER01b]
MKKYPSDDQDYVRHDDQLEESLRKSVFNDQFKQDINYWKKTSPKKLARIRQLMEGIMQDPFKGKGHPKPLKYQGSDVWSRKIDEKHRIVYLVSVDQIDFLQARFHYDDM